MLISSLRFLQRAIWPKAITITIASSAMLFSSSISATPVTEYGFMSRAERSAYIIDKKNDRVWLGWDVTKGLSYSDTLRALGDGGVWAGFRVAFTADARLFATALGLDGNCPMQNYWGPVCGMGPITNLESFVGESYADASGWLGQQDHDYVWFLADDGREGKFGSLEMSTVYRDDLEIFSLYDYALDISVADAIGTNLSHPVGWLLYKEGASLPNASVDEPSSLALVLLAALAIAGSKRHSRLKCLQPAAAKRGDA